jgi:hypothetical protein
MLDHEGESESRKGDDGICLSSEERERVRSELRYAQLVLKESSNNALPKSRIETLLGLLSNGFVLLLIGSLLTSVIVPNFQKSIEQRTQRTAQMKECLSQFLLYTNTLWQEHYAVLPLTQVREIDREAYLTYVGKVAEIKLKRYDAYERIQALSVLFHKRDGSPDFSISDAIAKYQIEVNNASARIDKWLTGLYCTPFDRNASPCERFDMAFDPYAEHERIKAVVIQVGNTTKEDLARRLVESINKM